MSSTTRRVTAVGLALLMLVAASFGAMAAAPSVDTESTDTATTTELNDGGTQQYNATTSTYFNWSADSENSSITIMQDGRTLYEGSPEPETTVSGTSYYNVSLADDGSDYDGLEVGATESATLNITMTNNTGVDDPDTTNVSYTFANGEATAFVAGTDADTEIEAEDDGIVSSLAFWGNDSEAGAAKITDETTITNGTDDIVVDIEQSDAIESFDAVSGEDSEGLVLVSYTSLDGQLTPVFIGSADAEWLDDSEQTYVMLDDNGESATIMNAGEQVDEETTVDIEMTGNEALGFFSTRSMLSNYEAGTIETLTTSANTIDFDGEPEFEEV